MKALEWNPRHYLGKEMYAQWQEALTTEEDRNLAREKRREIRKLRKERRLQRELQKEIRGKKVERGSLARRKSVTSNKDMTNTTTSKAPAAAASPAPMEQDLSEITDRGGVKIAIRRSNTAEMPTTTSGNHHDPSDDRRLPVVRSHSARRMPLPALSNNNSHNGGGSPPSSSRNQRASMPPISISAPASATTSRKPRQLKLLSRLGMRRPSSSDKLTDLSLKSEGGGPSSRLTSGGLPLSPSMPMIAQAASFPDVGLDHSPSSTLNHSVVIDMPPSPSRTSTGEGTKRGDYEGVDNDSVDEEKGNLHDNEVGLSNIL
jgi:hypothetical protein